MRKDVLLDFILMFEKMHEYFMIRINSIELDNYEINLLSFFMVQFYLKLTTFQNCLF